MPGRIQSVVRAAEILELIEFSSSPLHLGEISEELGLPKPTVHGLMRTLLECDFIEQDRASGRYSAGPRLGPGARRAMDRHELRSAAMSWTDSLAMSLRSEACLALLEGDGAVIAHHVFRPDDTEQELRVGERLPLHATAPGKLLLAYSRTRDRLLRNLELTRYTVSTTTVRSRLLDELTRIRARGYAASRGEFEPEVYSVAVLIRGLGHGALATLAVRGTDGLLVRDEAAPGIVDELHRHAASIAAALRPVR